MSSSLAIFSLQSLNPIPRVPQLPVPVSSSTTTTRRFLRANGVTPKPSPSHSLPAPSSSLQDERFNGSATEVDRSLPVKKKALEISYELKGSSIFLVGMNSRVKTDLGKLLAEALQYYYFDSDSLIEQAAGGESAAKSLRERDEKGFLESETEVLKQLSSMGRLVVCAGDGAVGSSTNLAFLRHGISIWIDVPLDMVAREVTCNGNHFTSPELPTSGSHSEVMAQLVQQYKDLKGGYATADATVSLQKVGGQLGYEDLDEVTTEDMALEVLSEIEKLMRVKRMMEDAARPF